jgi:membrane associated rhomboid family serine protease
VSEDPEKPTLLDAIVGWIAGLMDGLGLNGTRLRWKWRQRQVHLGERSLKTEMAWRSARAQHKMCPECRALVDRSARACPQCRASMSAVSTPGFGRMVANMFPGMSAVTGLILLVNGFVFLMLMMAHAKAGIEFGLFSSFDYELMARFGGGLNQHVQFPDGSFRGGEPWRLITPIFMHWSMMHFFFNSFLLVQIGPLVQELYGAKYWVIYLTCGIAASAASMWTRSHQIVMAGASGAIMGLIGLLLVHGLRHRGQLGQAMKSLFIRLVLYTVVLSLVFSIDHRAHLGGFLCGVLFAFTVPSGEPRSPAARAIWSVLSLVGVLLVLISFAMIAGLDRYF